MASIQADKAAERLQRRQDKRDRKQQPRQNNNAESGERTGSSKLRGRPTDSAEARLSKTLSWLLRHGAQSEGLKLRVDGYARVTEVLNNGKLRELTFERLQALVKNDAKSRYNLIPEVDLKTGEEIWWIRANQGHSIKTVALDLEPIVSHADIPTGIAVHGTNKRAWESIKDQGLSKMNRNHIHLAQGVAGSGVISGMRTSSEILIFIDVQKALDAGIKFYLSANSVVLTAGDERGFLSPEFFSRVENSKRQPLPGWDGPEGVPKVSTAGGSDYANSTKTSIAVGISKRDEAVQTDASADTELLELGTRGVESATL